MASATRSTEPPLLVSVGETSVETFIEIQSLVKQLSAARVAEDVTGIKKVIESIKASTNLTEKQREQLIQLATQAKTGIAPQEGIDEDSTLDALNKLAGPSRGAQDYYYNILYKNGSRKTRSFATYRAALESLISDNIMNNVSDIVGPPTLFSFPPDTTIRGSLPPGHFLVKD